MAIQPIGSTVARFLGWTTEKAPRGPATYAAHVYAAWIRNELFRMLLSTPTRGTVYIHASSKLDRAALDWLRDQAHVTPPAEFVHGAVIAVVEIVGVVTEPEAAAFAPWFFGPYGFVVANIRTLRTPVPEKGRLGLARASDDLRRRVARALRSTEPH